MKYITFSIVLVFVSITFGLILAFWLSKHWMHGVPKPTSVTIERVAGGDVLFISLPEHPPWAHSSFYDVEFDYKAGFIDISEMEVFWNPFSQKSYGRPPIVIKYGLLPQTYKVRYWDGEQYISLGTLTVTNENKLLWRAMDSDKNRP
jgi:hypothetical protein